MCVCACEPVLLYPVLCLVSQSCPAPCYSMDSSVHGFPRQEYWSGLSCPPPGDYPDLGMEPMSLALQVDPLPSEPPGKPTNTGAGSLSLLQGIFLTQESNQGFRRIVYQLSYQGSPVFLYTFVNWAVVFQSWKVLISFVFLLKDISVFRPAGGGVGYGGENGRNAQDILEWQVGMESWEPWKPCSMQRILGISWAMVPAYWDSYDSFRFLLSLPQFCLHCITENSQVTGVRTPASPFQPLILLALSFQPLILRALPGGLASVKHFFWKGFLIGFLHRCASQPPKPGMVATWYWSHHSQPQESTPAPVCGPSTLPRGSQLPQLLIKVDWMSDTSRPACLSPASPTVFDSILIAILSLGDAVSSHSSHEYSYAENTPVSISGTHLPPSLTLIFL